MTAQQFQQLLEQNELIFQQFELINQRFSLIDQRFEQVDERFEQVDRRFEQVDRRFEQIDQRFDRVDQRFDKVDECLAILTQKVIKHDEQLAAIFTILQNHEQRLQYIEENMATKQDIAGIYKVLDYLVSFTKRIEVEHQAIISWLNRHDKIFEHVYKEINLCKAAKC